MSLPFAPSPRFPKELLLEVLKVASGAQVEWSTSKRPALGLEPDMESAWVLVSARRMGNEGTDEVRRQYNPSTDLNDVIEGGQRSCILSLRAISMDDTLEAFDLLSRVRFQLRTSKCAALMDGVLALHAFQAITPLPGDEIDGRAVLVATMDVGLGYVDQSDPLDPEEGNYVKTTDVANNGALDGNPVGPVG